MPTSEQTIFSLDKFDKVVRGHKLNKTPFNCSLSLIDYSSKSISLFSWRFSFYYRSKMLSFANSLFPSESTMYKNKSFKFFTFLLSRNPFHFSFCSYWISLSALIIPSAVAANQNPALQISRNQVYQLRLICSQPNSKRKIWLLIQHLNIGVNLDLKIV